MNRYFQFGFVEHNSLDYFLRKAGCKPRVFNNQVVFNGYFNLQDEAFFQDKILRFRAFLKSRFMQGKARFYPSASSEYRLELKRADCFTEPDKGIIKSENIAFKDLNKTAKEWTGAEIQIFMAIIYRRSSYLYQDNGAVLKLCVDSPAAYLAFEDEFFISIGKRGKWSAELRGGDKDHQAVRGLEEILKGYEVMESDSKRIECKRLVEEYKKRKK